MLLTASTDDSRSELYSSIFNRRSQLSLAMLLSFVKHTLRMILFSFYLTYLSDYTRVFLLKSNILFIFHSRISNATNSSCYADTDALDRYYIITYLIFFSAVAYYNNI